MPTAGNGAIAALDYNDDERRRLADKSREASTASLRSHGCVSPFILPSCPQPDTLRACVGCAGRSPWCLLPTIFVSLSFSLSRVSLGKCVYVCVYVRALYRFWVLRDSC